MNQLPLSNAQSGSSRFDPDNATKQCPACAETIKLEARLCRFCNHPFSDAEVQEQRAQAQRRWEESHKSVTFYSGPHLTVTSEQIATNQRLIPIASVQPVQVITETSAGRFGVKIADAAGNVLEVVDGGQSDLVRLQTFAQAINNAINAQRGLPPGIQPIQIVSLNKSGGMGWCAWVLVIAAAIVLAVIVMSFL